MDARLNITMDAKLYRRLKREIPPRGISAFIEAAVRRHLRPDRETLAKAYAAARLEPWRKELEADWAITETEGWPA